MLRSSLLERYARLRSNTSDTQPLKCTLQMYTARKKCRFILLLVRLRYSCSGPRSLLSVVYLFLSLTGGTPRRLVRHHRSGVQKKQDDTRQSSNGRQSRSPPTYVITELQTSLDLRKIILTGNNPDGPASCCCKFLVVFSLPVSSAVRCRVLCRRTIGAGTSVRLGFPNARPVVFDGNVT